MFLLDYPLVKVRFALNAMLLSYWFGSISHASLRTIINLGYEIIEVREGWALVFPVNSRLRHMQFTE